MGVEIQPHQPWVDIFPRDMNSRDEWDQYVQAYRKHAGGGLGPISRPRPWMGGLREQEAPGVSEVLPTGPLEALADGAADIYDRFGRWANEAYPGGVNSVLPRTLGYPEHLRSRLDVEEGPRSPTSPYDWTGPASGRPYQVNPVPRGPALAAAGLAPVAPPVAEAPGGGALSRPALPRPARAPIGPPGGPGRNPRGALGGMPGRARLPLQGPPAGALAVSGAPPTPPRSEDMDGLSRGDFLVRAGLGMMSSASKPHSSLFGSIGEGFGGALDYDRARRKEQMESAQRTFENDLAERRLAETEKANQARQDYYNRPAAPKYEKVVDAEGNVVFVDPASQKTWESGLRARDTGQIPLAQMRSKELLRLTLSDDPDTAAAAEAELLERNDLSTGAEASNGTPPAASERVVGQIYDSPKGKVRWEGDGWTLVEDG